MKALFAQSLETLQNALAEQAAQAENSVHQAHHAMEENDLDEAKKVIRHDHDLDDEEIRIEEECLKILALYQPVASDLRQVITILKVNNEVERIGDLAVNIAERVPDLALYQDKPIEKIDFLEMVSRSCTMLKQALDSLTYHDVALAAQVIQADEAVDVIHRDNYGRVRDAILAHPTEAQFYMDYLTISRCYERIADIATNIAEDVIYLESGRIVRHQNEGEGARG